MTTNSGASPPARRPTKYDVAKRAGVSPTTVTFVLTGRDVKLADSTRERVRRAAEELGYQPNRLAAALSSGRTGLVSFWLSTLNGAYHSSLAQSVTAQIGRSSYQVVVNLFPAWNVAALPEVGGTFPVDGLLVACNVSNDMALVHALKRAHPSRPVVSIGFGGKTDADVDTVTFDLMPGAAEAVTHLVASGRRRVAFLRTDHADDRTGDRAAAYLSVVGGAGREPEYVVSPTRVRAGAREAIKEHIGRHGCPDGLFCLNDEMALGAYRALCDLGIRVPEDVALIGCDGIEDTEYSYCPLSTIVLPLAQMAESGWRLLERRMRVPDAPLEHIVLPAYLVLRQSSQG